MSEKSMTVIGVKDMWNATNERTIDGRDVVLVQVTERRTSRKSAFSSSVQTRNSKTITATRTTE